MAGNVVVFDPQDFRDYFAPAFDDVEKYPDRYLTAAFRRAEGFINNTPCSKIKPLKERQRLLYLATAHLLTLATRGGDATDSAGSVGRITSATQGPVSASFGYTGEAAASFWTQTQYGAEFWELTKKFRSFLWVPGNPCRW